MAENTVVKEMLSEEMIEAGAELTAKLDELKLPVSAAMWFFMPDINEWRLLIASPNMSTEGPQNVYKQIETARKLLGEKAAAIPLSVIGLLDTSSQIVQLLRVALQTSDRDVSRIRFSKNVIDGFFIDDALIYRIA